MFMFPGLDVAYSELVPLPMYILLGCLEINNQCWCCTPYEVCLFRLETLGGPPRTWIPSVWSVDSAIGLTWRPLEVLQSHIYDLWWRTCSVAHPWYIHKVVVCAISTGWRPLEVLQHILGDPGYAIIGVSLLALT